jgi:hypothetical protein
MRTSYVSGRALALVSLFVSSSAGAYVAPSVGALEGRIVSAKKLDPVEGVTVIASRTDAGYFISTASTDANGVFEFELLPGTYDLFATFGDARWLHQGVKVEANRTTMTPGVLAVEPSEYITVHEKIRHESRPAEPVRSTVKPHLPYSDEIVDRNLWVIGWMLLDVDAKGAVTGFRYLHRPGHDLEAITEREVFKLRFAPARDDDGRAMASKVLWKFEWPSYWWAVNHFFLIPYGGRGALSPLQQSSEEIHDGARFYDSGSSIGRGPFRGVGAFLPPCRNDGPLNLDLYGADLRDCSAPDFSRLASERLITPAATR